MLPAGYEYQDEGLRKAKAEGRAEGEARGKAEGEARGEARGKAEGVLAVLQARGLQVSPQQRERIVASADVSQLDAWLRLAATATTADALFAH